MGGLSPKNKDVVSEAVLVARLQSVVGVTREVRFFGATGGLEIGGRVAHALGLKAVLSAWIGGVDADNRTEIDNLVAAVDRGEADDWVIVGSEVLRRWESNDARVKAEAVSPEKLAEYLRDAKRRLGGRVKLAYADIYQELMNHPTVAAEVDGLFINVYAYWEEIEIGDAIRKLHLEHRRLVAAYPGKSIIVGETGWPSEGDQRPAPRAASAANAATYLTAFRGWQRATGVRAFYFAAFDERWKLADEPGVGSHWGIFDENGNLKPGIASALAATSFNDVWSYPIPGVGGAPRIELQSVPPRGTADPIVRGRLLGVDPALAKLVAYILVGGQWWPKPTFAHPYTLPGADGSFSFVFKTAATDENTSEVAVFALPARSGFFPPANAIAAFAPELLQAAIASIVAPRA